MAYRKKGYNPISLENLSKGGQTQKLRFADCKSKELAALILNEEVEYNGALTTNREAILREQVKKAIEGELRSCQFLFELAGLKEQPATADNTKELSPLEELYSKMEPRKLLKPRHKP